MLEIRNRKTLQSKIIVRKSNVKIGDCAHSLLLPGDFASSGKTPLFRSFSQASPTVFTTTSQGGFTNTPRSKYVFIRVGPQHPSLSRPLQSDSNGQQNIQSSYEQRRTNYWC